MKTKRLSFRWVLIGLLSIPLAYAAFFFNYYLVYAGIAEKVTIQNGNVQLAGLLVKPDTPGPHPGVVLLHGSGTNQVYDKWYYRIHTNVLVRQGFAVLSYNKRGSGDSQIDYRTVTFQDLIEDAVAAIDLLRNRTDVIPGQIGLFGVSESGWLTPEIASRAGDIAFIVNRVSSPLLWTETVSYEFKTELINEGYNNEEISEILQLQNRIWEFYIESAKGESNAIERDAINTVLADTLNRPGGAEIFEDSLAESDSDELAARASKYAYDPYPYLAEIDISMLYILAEDDVNIPFEASRNTLEQLKGDFNKDISIQAYPDTGHYLYQWEWFPLEGLYVPGYLDLIGDWAMTHIK